MNTLLNESIEIIKQTGNYIRDERKKFTKASVISKGSNDFVSHVDKSAEELLVKGLGELLPESGFIAEEGTSTKRGDKFNWIIDPLDGTTNFIHGAPPYSVSVALMEDEEIVLGVVYEITLDECFYSAKGLPAFLNGNEIQVSDITTVKDSLIATGFPYTDFHRIDAFMDTLKDLFQNTHGVRRLGSAAADLAYVACGRYDAFYEYNLKPWDVAAGAFLVNQAGGKSTDFKNGNDYIFGKEIISTNSKIHSEFLSRIECLRIENFVG
jgi:myo-inositol-1(or 4)-monophosphatase